MSESIPTVSLQEQLRVRQPAVRVICTLIAVNVLVFLAMLLGGAGLGLAPADVHLNWGANFGPATQDGEWWRLGSAMFLHFGVVHLAMNMWALWDGGQLVERMFGPGRFVAVYALSGVSGNLLSLVTHHGRGVSGGASGAIFGIYGALLVYLWRERGRLHPREFRWLFWGAAAFSLATIVLGLLIPGIDNAAHIGGFLCGMLSGVCLSPSHAQKGWLRIRVRAGALLLLSWVLLVGQIPAPAYRWRDEANARAEIARFMKSEALVNEVWQEILGESKRGDASFESLAGRIEADIADSYERSFEHLSQLYVTPALPSGPGVEALREYAARRRDASRLLADGLRENDAGKVNEALALERKPKRLDMGHP